MRRKYVECYEISEEFEDKVFLANYSVQSGVVTVTSSVGQGSTQVGGASAKYIAHLLFREILNGAKVRGDIKP